MKAKKVISLVLLLAMAASILAACGNQAGDAQTNADAPPKTQIASPDAAPDTEEDAAESVIAESVVIGTTSNPSNISPWDNSGVIGTGIQRCLYETLMDIDPKTGVVEFVLAKGYDQIDEYTYDIYLYDYIFDQNGNHITADDIVWNYEQMGQTRKAGGMRAMKELVATNDYTLHLTLDPDEVSPGTFESLMRFVPIVSKATYEAAEGGMQEYPISTSRYVVTDFVSGASVTAELSDTYWQTDESLVAPYSQANVKKITWLYIPEPSQISIALETGTIDGSPDVATADIVNFEENGAAKAGFFTYNNLAPDIYRIVFNCRDTFSDPLLRQAVCYAIDNEAITLSTFGNMGVTCKNYGTIAYADYDSALDDESYYEYNPEKAKELLKQAGYENGLTVKAILTSDSKLSNIVQLVQAYCNEVGITVEPVPYESAMYTTTYESEEGEWDIAVNTTFSAPYLSALFGNFKSDTYAFGVNEMLIADPVLDELANTASSIKTHSVDTVSDVVRYMDENVYAYAISSYYKQYVTSDKFKTIVIDFQGGFVPNACTYYE